MLGIVATFIFDCTESGDNIVYGICLFYWEKNTIDKQKRMPNENISKMNILHIFAPFVGGLLVKLDATQDAKLCGGLH